MITGSRKDDKHWVTLTDVVPSETWKVGDTTFYAPLYNWTREQVKEGLRARGLDADEVADDEDTGHLLSCTNCLKGKGEVFCPKLNEMVPSVQWEPSLNLANYRQTYG